MFYCNCIFTFEKYVFCVLFSFLLSVLECALENMNLIYDN